MVVVVAVINAIFIAVNAFLDQCNTLIH